ncbi:hypothetical protein BMR1_02g00505 [Babesia microti strain RI]|uniref:Uncharacterized protein n=1 Tax=Babesia microti (strain RI) TaxID=1133968 RepID=I7J5W3_BABMR|nr:hypothetical protein BMR1_02g00505 [Babesia microti strain RI]CCF73267.1 hypothetical protein BMR1_02g00505 [Babesia microti strain RI]|eukprot:XP_012647876.1 hypothetical protein BMR1_02g00505 [Babesia microti strain RI]
MDGNLSSVPPSGIDINSIGYCAAINNDTTSADVSAYKDAEDATNENDSSKSTNSCEYGIDNAINDEKLAIFTQLQSELSKLEHLQDIFQKMYLKVLFNAVGNNKLKAEYVTLYRLLCGLKIYKKDGDENKRIYSPIRSANYYYQLFRHLSQLYRLSEFLKLVFMLFILNVPVEVLYFAIFSYCGYCAILSLSLYHSLSDRLTFVYGTIKRIVNYIKILLSYNRNHSRQYANQYSIINDDSTNLHDQDSDVDGTVTSGNTTNTNGVTSDNDIVNGQTSSEFLYDASIVNSSSDSITGITGMPVMDNVVELRELLDFQSPENSGLRNRFQQFNPGNTENQTQPVRQIRDRSYVEKFCYQLFFSFFMSLIPWWTPNPEYL